MKKQFKTITFNRNLSAQTDKKTQYVSFYTSNKEYLNEQMFLVPNIVEFMHDVTENGQIGALKTRILRLSPINIMKLMWWNKFRLLKIAKKDFASGVLILLQIEILQIQKYNPSFIILSDYITDLALALNNRAIYHNFCKLMMKTATPICFFTNNLPLFIDRCLDWRINPDFIFTPINTSGYEMNPDKKTVENYLQRIPAEKIVAVITARSAKQDTYLDKRDITKRLTNWFD